MAFWKCFPFSQIQTAPLGQLTSISFHGTCVDSESHEYHSKALTFCPDSLPGWPRKTPSEIPSHEGTFLFYYRAQEPLVLNQLDGDAATCDCRGALEAGERDVVFGARSRSTCVRLVLSSAAILFLEIFFSLIASASCQATTSLTACVCASSKMPSSLRKSSILEPECFLLSAPGPSSR
jgi:hypothetical protein